MDEAFCATTEKTMVREYHEWIQMRWLNERDTALPRVLLVGDSIVAGHVVAVHERLKERFCVDCFATSKHVTDADFMADLEMMLGRKRYALIVFNNGLHGFEIDDALYGPALRERLVEMKTRTPRLAWRSSTPVYKWPIQDGRPELHERTPRILRRNADALAEAQALNLPVLDLYVPMVGHPEFLYDGCHCTSEGAEFQSGMIAAFVETVFGERESP